MICVAASELWLYLAIDRPASRITPSISMQNYRRLAGRASVPVRLALARRNPDPRQGTLHLRRALVNLLREKSVPAADSVRNGHTA